MRVASAAWALAMSLVVIGNLMAAEEKAGKAEKESRHRGDATLVQIDWMVKGLNLTDDQKAKLEEIKKEYAPKVKEADQKRESILTPEQKKARKEAMKAAKAAGKKGGEAREEVQAAMKLTDEQKAKLAEARKAESFLRKEIRDKVISILSPEQKEQLKKDRKDRRRHEAESQ